MISGKSQPPRVYLDQNAWIKIARSHYGLENSELVDKTVQALIAAVDAG